MDIGQIVLGFVAFVFSLCFHELAHAWTSEKFGDDTGRYEGRITMDPRAHVDPYGTILFPLLGMASGGLIFGWAKPVNVNPSRWKNHVVANIAVSAAGPASNLLLAVASALIIKLLVIGVHASGGFGAGALSVITPVVLFLKIMMSVNVILAVFNMLPIPPLDGSHILATLLSLVSPSLMEAYESLRPYGWLILIAASFTGIVSKICAPIYSLVMSGLNAWL